MPETIPNAYRRLLETRLLHHYWLDDATTPFDQIADAGQRATRLANYDARPFLAVTPTEATASALRGAGCLFRQTPLGFTVLAPAGARFAADAVLEFAATATDPDLFGYTALTLPKREITAIYAEAEQKLYRFKAGVPTLSNLTGAARGSGADLQLFLSREYGPVQAGDRVEAMVKSGAALKQLTSDGPGADLQVLATKAVNAPVYLHQGDVAAITPPAGMTGVPERGIQLTAGIPDAVFALIRLTAVRGDNDAFSFVDGSGAPKPDPPVYQVRFKNRSTFWRYVDGQTGAEKSISGSPQPFTWLGTAGTQPKPSRRDVKAELNGGKIVRLISEIHV